MNRFARTRSDQLASQPLASFAQCSVGSIDEDGIRYGLTTHALIASTIATAPAIVTIQSIATRHGRGRFAVIRSIGFSLRFLMRSALCAIARFGRGRPRAAPRARATRGTPQVGCTEG